MICVCADSKKELEENIEQVKMTAKSYTVELSTHKYRQLDAFKTILPTAARFVDTMRPLFTTAVSGFVPFNVQEFYDPSGFFYGVNQISGKEIRINRKKLKNGNGFAFGISGSGKSQDVKLEIGQVIVYTDDDVLIADPMGEYRESVDEWNGHYITFGTGENAEYINPLHIPEGIKNEKDFITGKAEFMYALCEQAIKPDALTNKHINIIDRAVKDVYEEFFELRLNGETTDSPVITDIRNKFIQYHKETGNKYAEDLAEELEMFVTGTLNVFTHQQTLKRDNRVMGYSLDSLGKKMKSIAMLVIIEEIRTRIKYNKGNKKATWVYFDEIHEFWDDDYAVAELDATWREIRKNGGLATGMTQMILDGLKNPNTKAMISNSEFTMLLEQGNVDKENLFDVFDISNEQLSYVCGVTPGTGIIRAGKKIIPFDNVVPKNNKLYELYNTSFHDEDIEDEE